MPVGFLSQRRSVSAVVVTDVVSRPLRICEAISLPPSSVIKPAGRGLASSPTHESKRDLPPG